MRIRNLTLPLLLVLLVIAVYAHSTNNQFIYDDLELIVKQEPVRDWPAWRKVLTEPHWHSLPYYRPISRATIVIQKSVHGDAPAAYHIFNVLVMAGCGLVVWFLLRGKPFEITPPLAYYSAAFFTLHPIASSCVYPICSGRESMIPALFILIALVAWLQPGRASAVAGNVAAVCALLSKEQAVVLPLILFAADRLLRTENRRTWTAYLPFLICWPLYFWIRHEVMRDSYQASIVFMLPLAPFGPLQTLLYAIQTWFLPYSSLAYEPEWSVWFSLPRVIGALSILAVLIILGIRLARPSSKVVLFWVIWIGLLVAPTANILSQDARFAERYVWLASLGFISVVAQGISAGTFGRSARRFGIATFSITLLIFALMSFGRNTSFATRSSFLEDWLASNPQSSQANYAYAVFLQDEGATDEAKAYFLKSLDLGGIQPQILYSLGNLQMHLDEIPEAIAAFEQVVMKKPDHYLAWRHLGWCYAVSGQPEKAAHALDKSLALKSDHHLTLYYRGVVENQAGRNDRAEAYFQRALDVFPGFPTAHYSLGLLAFEQDAYPEALSRFRKVIDLDPDHADAHNAAGIVLLTMGDTNAAREAFEEAVRLEPDHPEAKQNLQRHF